MYYPIQIIERTIRIGGGAYQVSSNYVFEKEHILPWIFLCGGGPRDGVFFSHLTRDVRPYLGEEIGDAI